MKALRFKGVFGKSFPPKVGPQAPKGPQFDLAAIYELEAFLERDIRARGMSPSVYLDFEKKLRRRKPAESKPKPLKVVLKDRPFPF